MDFFSTLCDLRWKIMRHKIIFRPILLPREPASYIKKILDQKFPPKNKSEGKLIAELYCRLHLSARCFETKSIESIESKGTIHPQSKAQQLFFHSYSYTGNSIASYHHFSLHEKSCTYALRSLFVSAECIVLGVSGKEKRDQLSELGTF